MVWPWNEKTKENQDKKQEEQLTQRDDTELGFTDEAASEDVFGISAYIEGLATFISTCSTPMTISVQGSWGTGKTSIMNLVNNELLKRRGKQMKREIEE